nr:type IV secretion system protein [uncultured Acidocella sp.]
MATAPTYAPFFTFDQTIQTPFSNGMSGTVSAAMSAIQGPLTAVIVLWVIVTGILVMRGDVTARTGITRIISVSLVVGILMSATLYNEYVVNFFTAGLPDWIASSLTNSTGAQASAHQFDVLWDDANLLFSTALENLNFYNVLDSVELGLLQDIVVFPIGLTFLIYELAKIMMDIMVSIGPFLLAGYLFAATRPIADRWVGKLLTLTILTLLVDIVLSIIIQGDTAYFQTALAAESAGATLRETITIGIQFVIFITIGSLITIFLPGIAAFLGGGVSVSPFGLVAQVAGGGGRGGSGGGGSSKPGASKSGGAP